MDSAHLINQWLDEHHITEVECLIPDMTGLARGKIVPRHKYDPAVGLRLPEAVLSMTVTGDYPDRDFTSVADPDMKLLPDLSTLRPVPWNKEPTAQIIHDCYSFGGEAVDLAPRNVLKRILKLYEDQGWKPVIAPEMEFYLVEIQPDEDLPLRPPVGRTRRTEAGMQSFSIDAVNEYDDIFDVMYDWCEAQGLALDTLIHEMGTAQMEINLDHGDPLQLADQVFLFKRTVREVAIRNNMYATFMAKPMQGQPGSAMHMHQSVVDIASGRNIFSLADGQPSPAFLHFIGGLQRYLPAAMPFFAPYVNSYRRLSRYTSAPINLSWGYDNRTCGLRVPHSDPEARRVENRLAGVDVNPYLAMAASLACGYLGMRDKIDPSEPLSGSAYEQPHQLPRHLDDAIDMLLRCQPLAELFGGHFVETYAAIKEAEYREYFDVISPWERRFLLLHV
ncbi:glutamine synthetase family protein [Chromobacterium vaccinii]|uniref:Glutamine synthetase family protein n=3 Tax=Chromobacteriaceae TaxID=1499392 RepID=A0ABV0HBR2_9NEIS|nr:MULTISPECIES: glutamine synthetase family protein [Chromobacteriaceae]AVG16437.1 glutamine synthetase [Chromobacterium vaccinii]ERE06569.1 glutamine synthetase [Pseudogulbenkiania ferrooxidans EGD-HP2]MBX9295172.1 glutamine synthetase family protein [Chromobacterium vaccinii]MBX9346478.1 glutamine synthetase family protein [Chromobacterium vaccinii]MBX9359261.1 glutamine synthetase family protein [Chromobacterium vaccinii]